MVASAAPLFAQYTFGAPSVGAGQTGTTNAAPTTAADRDARRRRVRSQSDAATTRDHTPGADLVNGDVSDLRGRLAQSGGSAGRCGGVTNLHLPDFSGCKAQLQNLAALAQVLLI
jgi:hypothetical protein